MNTPGNWRGVAALVRDAVEHGSRAVERVQIESAERTFAILERIPPIAGATRIVHAAHDASVASVHTTIRVVNAAVGGVVAVVLEQIEKRRATTS
jgi:hypothetical protein